MNRRDLLKLGAPALVLTSLAPPRFDLASIPHNPDEFIFHGWKLKWRDWLEMINQDVKVGIWVAYSTDQHGYHIASPWPGPIAVFLPGALIDIHCLENQIIPDGHTSKEELAWMQNEALERLKRVIVKIGQPPIQPDGEKGWSWFYVHV
jgi:hypothetical protein